MIKLRLSHRSASALNNLKRGKKMKRSEIFDAMSKVKGGSALNLRSETNQSRVRPVRIPSLKKDIKKKAKLLLVSEIALPFNPETGIADDDYNEDHKFRPALSATTVALYLKGLANENQDLKETLMKRAGMTEWDTESEEFTEEDWKIFVKYRVPRVFTIPVVHINIPVMCKSQYGQDYSISVERDPLTGDIVGEWPIALKINKLFRDKIYEEISEYNDKIAKGEIHASEKEQKDKKYQMYSQNPVSDDHPANWVELIELPLANNYELSGDLDFGSLDVDEIKGRRVLSKYTNKIKTVVERYTSGEFAKFDTNFDFFEIEMVCPISGDTSSDVGKQQLGQNTTFEKPTEKLSELNPIENYDKIIAAVHESIDSESDIEETVYRSVRIPPYNETVEQQLVAALPTVLQIDDKYVTDSVINANQEIISLAFGDEGQDIVERISAGLSSGNEGSLDEGASMKEAKTYDLSSPDFTDDLIEATEDVLTEEVPFD